MITFTLAFLALIFMPGYGSNYLLSKLFCASSVVCVLFRTGYKIKACEPQYLFAAMLAWMFLGSSICDNNIIASTGYWDRMEGFITWFILSVVAWTYWNQAEGDNRFDLFKLPWNLRGFSQLFLLVILSFIAFIIISMFLWQIQSFAFNLYLMPNNALAGFAAIGFILLYAYHPIATLPAILIILETANRTALVAILAALVCYYLLTAYKKALKVLVIACLIGAAVIPFTDVYNRLASFHASTVGSGSRSQWVLQGSELARSVPVTGYGLDTLSRYLKPAKGYYVHNHAVVDRTHYLPFDIILQIGWLGYFLCLLILSYSIHIVLTYRTKQNIICLCIITSWIIFNCFNPCGIYGHLLMLLGLFGIRKDQNATQSDRDCNHKPKKCLHSSVFHF